MKTLKITISIVTTFFVLFLFTTSLFAQLEFVGNYNDGMGGAGWDADGSGPEPYGNGNGGIFYYTASRDYLDGEEFCGAELTDVLNGFPLFEQALVENGYSYEQVTLKFGLADLGDDMEGIDNFSLGGIQYCNFYPTVITFELDGEPLVEATGNYAIYITGANVRDFESGFLKIHNISNENTEEVASAFMADMASEELQLKMTISPYNAATFVNVDGRTGAYIDVTCTLEKGLPEIPMQGLISENEGTASWDADGTGPEPYGNGHEGIVYYSASVDYDGINPDPEACLAHFLEGSQGFRNTLLQLQYRGYLVGDLKLKMGLCSLGPDVYGEDWSNENGVEWLNEYNNRFTIELNGEPILEALQDTNKMTFINPNTITWATESSVGKIYDISQNASPEAQFVAQSFLKDLGSHYLVSKVSDITYNGPIPAANGRSGVYYDLNSGAMVGVHEKATFIPEGEVGGAWTLENSPYYIEGPVTIENGQTLEIEPGVRVGVRGPYHFTVQGCVKAEGLEDEKIIFTSSNPNLMWDGFEYDGTPVSNSTSIFDHCIFKYGKAQGTFPFNCGGAFAIRNFNKIDMSNSIFRNNMATEGTGASGGAISLWNASPAIYNCIFYDNSAYLGGAIMCYNESSPEISRSLFYNNNAEHDGGAIQIYEDSHPNIINNTFSMNTAGNYGGAVDVYSFSNPEFINNIFWGNSAISNGAQISISMSNCDITVKYCDVEGGEAGIGPYGIQTGIYENNMDEDPLFMDILAYDFHIPEVSPCHNAGDPTILDPDGSISDIGYCYTSCTTGIGNTPGSDSGLGIYPNPASSNITIANDIFISSDDLIEVFNFLGQKVDELRSGSRNGKEISVDISNYPVGTYFCKWTSGNNVRTAKFIKK